MGYAVEKAFTTKEMMEETRSESMVSYYRKTLLNAGEVRLETGDAWEVHVRKRLNLYGNHLQLPPSLLRDRSVLEFGCSSGENALVLAALGAQLTLVEPNKLVMPRLHQLFGRFGLESQIARLSNDEIADFQSDAKFDLVLAEGFLFSLPDRDAMVAKFCGWLKPGGVGIVSFNDRAGMLLECVKCLVLRRVCQTAGIDDVLDDRSLAMARRLFASSYGQLNASRALEVWWKDNLVSPFMTVPYLWSFPELLKLVERGGCEFHASSPKWSLVDHFAWYKNVPTTAARHAKILQDMQGALVYFLTGIPTPAARRAPDEVWHGVSELQSAITDYTIGKTRDISKVSFPASLSMYLAAFPDETVRAGG